MGDSGRCNIMKPKPIEGTCQDFLIDINDDGNRDAVRACLFEIKLKGDAKRCHSELKQEIPRIEEEYPQTSSTYQEIKVPMAAVVGMGVGPSFFHSEDPKKSHEASEFRRRQGVEESRYVCINSDDAKTNKKSEKKIANDLSDGIFKWEQFLNSSTGKNRNEECFVKSFARQRYFVSYPVLTEKGRGVHPDVQNWASNMLPKFGKFKIGYGSWGTFTLTDGREVTGIVVRVGLYRYWGRADRDDKGEFSNVQFFDKDVNFIVYTVDTKTYESEGVHVDLYKIKDFKELTPAEKKKLSIEYRDAHESIPEMLKKMENLEQ